MSGVPHPDRVIWDELATIAAGLGHDAFIAAMNGLLGASANPRMYVAPPMSDPPSGAHMRYRDDAPPPSPVLVNDAYHADALMTVDREWARRTAARYRPAMEHLDASSDMTTTGKGDPFADLIRRIDDLT